MKQASWKRHVFFIRSNKNATTLQRDECSFQLKQPSWKGHIFLKRNAATFQGILQFLMKKFLLKKKHFSKIISILCQTVVHWHCWHAASSTNASCHLANTSCHLANTSCHLANTSCCLANLYVYIKRKRKPKKKKTKKHILQTNSEMFVCFLFGLYLKQYFLWTKVCL